MEREREVFVIEKEEMEQKYAEADQAVNEVRKILTMGKLKRRKAILADFRTGSPSSQELGLPVIVYLELPTDWLSW